ncbi:TOX high mobility group box family member 2 isoform X4 [Hemitrygon akajei]|uniref:TOX high mobility group box family member 2 isoform X4 n=1 Tax=Hemitrygon akajei TaxID=2704970 RepID=UPI003BF9C71E
MDVRFYPSAPATVGALAADPTCLGTASCLEQYYSNKFDGDNMYMSLTDGSQEYLPANQNFSSQGLGDEDYEIPPITPPNLGDPSFLHLMDPYGGYHSLCHAAPANGLLPQYPYQGMDLPAIMVSNMLSQDGHLLSNQLPMFNGEKRPSVDNGKKIKAQKKKKKKDPNEPQKPVSAYALFFRDTQAAIKGQNPSATFGDVSKIVASMWDGLGEEQKQAYKKKTEAAKKEYLKALAAYRASLVSKSYSDPVEPKGGHPPQQTHLLTAKQPLYSLNPQTSTGYGGPSSFLSASEMQTYSGPAHQRLSRTLTSKSVMPQMPLSGSPPPSLQISPPLHQQLPLHQQQQLGQPLLAQGPSQAVITHQVPLQVQSQLHSPPGQQGYGHLPSEFQSPVGAASPGSGVSNAAVQGNDWDSEYCNSECIISHCSMLPRDKLLYLT